MLDAHMMHINKKEPLYIKDSRLYKKESTGFEPARPLNTGSPDFESGALPLCQLSKNQLLHYNKFSNLRKVQQLNG